MKEVPDKYKVTGLMARDRIEKAQPTWSVGEDTVKHYDLELNVDLNCGELAEFLNYAMNTREFRDKVSVNERIGNE